MLGIDVRAAGDAATMQILQTNERTVSGASDDYICR
jgi:hypothetical protein